MDENFPTQEIKYLEALAGTNLETIECKQIPGIGSKKSALSQV
jgi:hypothetical protein